MKQRREPMRCGHRLWIEQDGQVVLGRGRVALLEAIDRQHSIRQAAASVGMSYRRAWLLVQRMNAAAREPLVETLTGGAQGGGTALTESGREAIALYRGLEHTVCEAADRHLAARSSHAEPASRSKRRRKA